MTSDELPAPLVVRVKAACTLLACSRPKLYRLLRDGEIKSYRDGGLRKIELGSLKAYVEKKVAEDKLGQ